MAKFYKFCDVLINLDNVTSIMKIKRPINNDIEEDVYEWGLYINYISGSPDRLFPPLASENNIDMYMSVIEYNS